MSKQPGRSKPASRRPAKAASGRARSEKLAAPDRPARNSLVGSSGTQVSLGTSVPMELPDLGRPQLHLFKMQVPAVWGDLAERGAAHCNDNWTKMKNAADETANVFQRCYQAAAQSYADYGAILIAAARANTTAAFDLAERMLLARSLSEMVEISAAHGRAQFDALAAQSKSLTALTRQIAWETAEPARKSLAAAARELA